MYKENQCCCPLLDAGVPTGGEGGLSATFIFLGGGRIILIKKTEDKGQALETMVSFK